MDGFLMNAPRAVRLFFVVFVTTLVSVSSLIGIVLAAVAVLRFLQTPNWLTAGFAAVGVLVFLVIVSVAMAAAERK